MFVFKNNKLRLYAIPMPLTFAKHRCKTFSACFMFIKWSSINYNLGATFAKKPASMDLATESQEVTLLTLQQTVIGIWSGTGSVLWEAVHMRTVTLH